MYTPATLARDRHRDRLEQALQIRTARQAAELRRLERVRHRAERKLLRVSKRASELRMTIGTAG